MRSLVIISLAIILIAGLLFTSCAKTTPTTTTVPAQTTASKPATAQPQTSAPATTSKPTASQPAAVQPQTGGVFKVITTSSVRNIGYPGGDVFPSDGTVARPAIEALIGMDESGSEAPVPQLATGWQFSADYKTLTFTLRKGIKFHDGTDFNAEAAKYCLDMVRESTRPELKSVSSIDIIDDYTIRLNLSSYEPTFLGQLIGMPTWMVSPTALKTLGKNAATNPVGTGPFKFVSYQRDTSVKYTKFDGYWGNKPYVDGIEWIIIADPVTALAAFKSGEAQAMTSVSPDDAVGLKKTGKYVTTSYYQMVLGFCGDSAHPDSPFANLKVRQAMAYTVDSKQIASGLGGEYYQPASQFSIAGSFGYNPKIVGYPYNIQKAKDLLTEAGFPNGFSTTLMYSSGTTNRDTFTAVQNYLGQIGIKVKLDEADSARFRDVTAKGWQNGLVSFDAPASKGYDPARMFVGRLSVESHRYDPGSLARSAEYDDLLAKSNVELDSAKRLAMLQELHRLMIDVNCMVIPLFAPASIKVETLQVHDLTMYGFGGPQDWQPTKVWLSK